MVEGAEANENKPGDAGDAASLRKRERSQIEFPYTDLDRAIDLCTHLAQQGGAGPIGLTQLAAAMDQTHSGGTFRGRLSAAKLFGLIDFGAGTAQLTKLGRDVLESESAAAAKAEAFLRIPLYARLYEQYEGYALPPAATIERQMRTLGVPEKQVERARQAFATSVTTAGFINNNGRFVKPVVSPTVGAQPAKEPENKGGGSGGGGGEGGGNAGGGGGSALRDLETLAVPSFIRGLLEALPPPRSQWSVAERADWLEAAAAAFKLMYKGGGSIKVTAMPPQNETTADQ